MHVFRQFRLSSDVDKHHPCSASEVDQDHMAVQKYDYVH